LCNFDFQLPDYEITKLRNFSEWNLMANTKSLSKEDRKQAKRTARKKATPKAKRTVPRGSAKRKVKKLVRGTSKR
jgi:hypothetical protein